MNLNWSNKVIKYVLFVFNLLFVISGIVMIAVGVSVKSYYTDYDFFLNDSYFSLPNLLIAIGSLIFFISFFGCCGAIRESWFMIFIFSILLSIIFIMELSAGIAGYVLRDKTADFLTEELKKTMKDYKFTLKPNNPTYMWDEIQETFHCCGTDGPGDWPPILNKSLTASPLASGETPTTTTSTTTTTTTTVATTTDNNVSTNSTEESSTPTKKPTTTTKTPTTTPTGNTTEQPRNEWDLPSSCCTSRPGTSGSTTCNLHDNSTAIFYKKGCVEGFGDYLKDHAVTIGGVGLAIGFIQLFGVIFACHLTKQLRHGFHST